MGIATSGVTMGDACIQGVTTVLHAVSDLATAKAVYAALLGIAQQADGSYYGEALLLATPYRWWSRPTMETR